MSDRPFVDQVAVVAGASGAIGGAIARRLGRAGASLLLLGRDRRRLERLERELHGDGVARGESGAKVVALPLDLESDEAFRALRRALARYRGVDVLIHAHGRFAAGSLTGTPVAELDRLLRVNFRSPLLLTRHCLPSLIARRGQVVFINSSAALRAAPEVASYALSKQALQGATDRLRDEVNRLGVRVLSVFPGRTASAMQRTVARQLGQPYQPERLMTPDDVAAMVVAALALPRSAEVTDIHLRPMLG